MTIDWFASGPHTRITIDTKWTKLPPDGADCGLFGAFQFGFVGGSGGYFGLQDRAWKGGRDRRMLFSVWDHPSERGSAHPLTCPYGKAQRFGGEGEGAQCIIVMPLDASMAWQVGCWHRFRLNIVVQSDGSTLAGCQVQRWYGAPRAFTVGVIRLTSAYGGQLSTWSASWNEQWAGDQWHCQRPASTMCWRQPRYGSGRSDVVPLASARTNYAVSTCEEWRRVQEYGYIGNARVPLRWHLAGDNGLGVVQKHPAGAIVLP